MKLSPCPFCGNPEDTKPEVMKVWQARSLNDVTKDFKNFDETIVSCEYCGACSESYEDPNEAMDAWNKRLGYPSERLESIIESILEWAVEKNDNKITSKEIADTICQALRNIENKHA